MTAGRHRPHPRPTEPEQPPTEVQAALDTYALHMRSLMTGLCLAPECDQPAPCDERQAAAKVLRAAGLLDTEGGCWRDRRV